MAQDLFYIAASSSLTLIKPNEPAPYIWNNVTSLEISGSAYDATISGSDFGGTVATARIYAYSGSTLLVSFPLEETNIYYEFSDYNFNNPILPFTSSFSYITWDFAIDYINTPEASGSGCTIYDSSSSTLYLSQFIESGGGGFPLISGNNYIFTVSGSGSYDAYMYLNDITSGSNIFTISSSNSYISTSYTPIAFHDYQVTFSVLGPAP
jgi:hypothetical protein